MVIATVFSIVLCTRSQKVVLQAIPSGAAKILGPFHPIRVGLVPGTGTAIKVPVDLKAPFYGEIQVQGKSFGVVADCPADQPYRIYVDSNGDGDFTNDPPVEFTKQNQDYGNGRPPATYYQGFGRINLMMAGKPVAASLGVYLFDQSQIQKPALKGQLFYYPDFAESGTVSFGKKRLNFILSDPTAMTETVHAENARLLFDRYENGTYYDAEDRYALDKPFKLGPTSDEVKSVSFSKGEIEFGPSKLDVPEIPLPFRLLKGANMIPFRATTLDGHSVNFPESFRNKVVLLDFWATWCGPCMAEAPNVAKNYAKYHSRGFEVLGISLDKPETAKLIPRVTKEKDMVWPEVCDKKLSVAKLYHVEWIPQAYLVDGNTGKLLAQGSEIRGEALGKALSNLFPDPIGTTHPR